MSRGFQVAGAGMMAQTKKIDTLANNIANARTSGFKKDNVITEPFSATIFSRQERRDREPIGPVTYGSIATDTVSDLTEGTIENTGNMYHVAILGEGFFTVRGANGQVSYTRNSEFYTDAQGFLAGNGGRLQGQNGDIYVGNAAFQILQNGTVLVSGQDVGTLAIYVPADVNAMEKLENGNFTGPANQNQFTGRLVQGSRELSNVDMTQEMINIMVAQRSYQANSQALKMIDSSLEKANEIAKL